MQNPPGTNTTRHGLLAGRQCLFVTIFLFFSLILLTANSYAQGSDLEKTVNKERAGTKKKTNTTKPASSKKRPPAKKTTARKPASNRTTKKRSAKRNSSTPGLVKFKFHTPAPDQEIWLGEEKLGVSNGESLFEKSLLLTG